MDRQSHGSSDNAPPSIQTLLLLKRKMSNWRKPPGSRKSSSVDAPRKIILRKENTYQLEPEGKERFNTEAVKKEAEDSLRLFLSAMHTYETRKCAQISRYVAEDIKGRVKKLGYRRHKIVAHVVIGEAGDANSLQVVSRCVWDETRDDCVTAVFKSGPVYAVATVFAIYFE